MGLLDDAIREHLDLKRRRGADPEEVERAEREALGPVRRAPEATDEVELSSDTDTERGFAYDHQEGEADTGRGFAYDHEEEHDWDDEPPEEKPAAQKPAGRRFLRRSKPAREPDSSGEESTVHQDD